MERSRWTMALMKILMTFYLSVKGNCVLWLNWEVMCVLGLQITMRWCSLEVNKSWQHYLWCSHELLKSIWVSRKHYTAPLYIVNVYIMYKLHRKYCSRGLRLCFWCSSPKKDGAAWTLVPAVWSSKGKPTSCSRNGQK